MRTARILSTVAAVLLLSTAVWAAEEVGGGVKPETTRLYQDAKKQVATLSESTPVKKHAADLIDKANVTIEAAQNGLKSLNDQETRQASELALLIVKLAKTVSEEKIATEKTVAAQQELTQLEQRLVDILAGKGEKP